MTRVVRFQKVTASDDLKKAYPKVIRSMKIINLDQDPDTNQWFLPLIKVKRALRLRLKDEIRVGYKGVMFPTIDEDIPADARVLSIIFDEMFDIYPASKDMPGTEAPPADAAQELPEPSQAMVCEDGPTGGSQAMTDPGVIERTMAAIKRAVAKTEAAQDESPVPSSPPQRGSSRDDYENTEPTFVHHTSYHHYASDHLGAQTSASPMQYPSSSSARARPPSQWSPMGSERHHAYPSGSAPRGGMSPSYDTTPNWARSIMDSYERLVDYIHRLDATVARFEDRICHDIEYQLEPLNSTIRQIMAIHDLLSSSTYRSRRTPEYDYRYTPEERSSGYPPNYGPSAGNHGQNGVTTPKNRHTPYRRSASSEAPGESSRGQHQYGRDLSQGPYTAGSAYRDHEYDGHGPFPSSSMRSQDYTSQRVSSHRYSQYAQAQGWQHDNQADHPRDRTSGGGASQGVHQNHNQSRHHLTEIHGKHVRFQDQYNQRHDQTTARSDYMADVRTSTQSHFAPEIKHTQPDDEAEGIAAEVATVVTDASSDSLWVDNAEYTAAGRVSRKRSRDNEEDFTDDKDGNAELGNDVDDWAEDAENNEDERESQPVGCCTRAAKRRQLLKEQEKLGTAKDQSPQDGPKQAHTGGGSSSRRSTGTSNNRRSATNSGFAAKSAYSSRNPRGRERRRIHDPVLAINVSDDLGEISEDNEGIIPDSPIIPKDSTLDDQDMSGLDRLAQVAEQMPRLPVLADLDTDVPPTTDDGPIS